MKSTALILFIFLSLGHAFSQTKITNQSVIDQLDELLFDSQYEEVIKRVDLARARDT